MAGFKIQVKSGPTAKWRDHSAHWTYTTEALAESAIRSWDQDGDFNRRAFRIVAKD